MADYGFPGGNDDNDARWLAFGLLVVMGAIVALIYWLFG